jgi:hypothetical protein
LIDGADGFAGQLLNGPRARRLVTVVGLLAAGSAFVFVGPPLCPTALFFGIPCPGCGLTRATLALLQGDVAAAHHFHPLVFVLAPVFAFAIGVSLLDYVRGGAASAPVVMSWLSVRARYRAAWGLLALTLAVWGARFAGYFGGPVPVENLDAVIARTRGEPVRLP